MTAVSLLLLVLLTSGGVASAQSYPEGYESPPQDSNPDSSGQTPPYYSDDKGSAASPDGTSPAPYQELSANNEQFPSPPSPDEELSDSALPPIEQPPPSPPPTEQQPPPTEQQPPPTAPPPTQPPPTQPPPTQPPPPSPSPQESDNLSGQTWGKNPSPNGQTWGKNPSPSGQKWGSNPSPSGGSGGGNPSPQSSSWWPWGNSTSSGNPGWWGRSPPPYSSNNPGGNPSNPSPGSGTGGSGSSGPPGSGGSSPQSPTGGNGQGGGSSNSAPPGSTSGGNGPPTTGCGAAGLGPAAAGLDNSTVTSGPPSASSLFGQTYQGIATYYGTQPQKGQGACSVNDANSWSLPWTSGINIPAALTHVQWDGSLPCGQCLAFRATGSGSGRNPLPESYQNAMIVDECPDADCEYGHLDLQITGDGAWGIEWYVMQCAVGSGTFQYSFQGSSSYYVKMQIANTRVPVASVIWNGKDQMQKTGDNYWLLTGGGYSLPAQVAVTSVLGDTVTDTVPAGNGFSGGVNGAGHGQFPAHPEYPTIGGATPATDASALAPPGPGSNSIVAAFDGPPSSSGDCGPPADSSQDSPPTATYGGTSPTTYGGSSPTTPPPSGGLSFLNNQGLFSSFGRRMKFWKDGMEER